MISLTFYYRNDFILTKAIIEHFSLKTWKLESEFLIADS